MEKELEQDDSLLSGIKRSLNYIALPSRNKYLKSQEDKLADIDSDLDRIYKSKLEAIEVVKNQKETNRLEFFTLRSKLEKAQTLRDRTRDAIEEARIQQLKQNAEDYKRRRELQVKEKHDNIARIRREAEELKEKQRQELRDFHQSHWTEQAEKLQQELKLITSESIDPNDTLESLYSPTSTSNTRFKKIGGINLPQLSSMTAKKSIKSKAKQSNSRPTSASTSYSADAEAEFNVQMFGPDPSSSTSASDDVQSSIYERLNESYQKQVSNTLKLTSQQYQLNSKMQVLQNDNVDKEALISKCMADKNKKIQEEIAHEKTLFKYLVRFPKEQELARKHQYKLQITEWNRVILETRQEIGYNSEAIQKFQTQLNDIATDLKLSKRQEGLWLAEMKKVSGRNVHLPIVVGTNIRNVDNNSIDNDAILRNANEINSTEGGPFTATITNEPGRLQSYLSERSKVYLYSDIKDNVAVINKDFKTVQQDIWIQKQVVQLEKEDTNQIISKLANLANEMNIARVRAHKNNVIDSIKLFFMKQVPLNPVVMKSEGTIKWFELCDQRMSRSVEMYSSPILPIDSPIDHSDLKASRQDVQVAESAEKVADEKEPANFDHYSTAYNGLKSMVSSSNESRSIPKALVPLIEQPKMKFDYSKGNAPVIMYDGGVTLSKDFVGTCFGTMTFPKRTVWSIHILIVRPVVENTTSSNEAALIDETDRVTISIGNGISSLTSVGTFYNKRFNPAYAAQPKHLPYIVHDVLYNFKGLSLTFRIDFHSSSLDTSRHMCVVPGNYFEYVMPPLQITYTKSMFGGAEKAHVLSSYVKQLRVEEKQGKMRLARLQEEYINASEALLRRNESIAEQKAKQAESALSGKGDEGPSAKALEVLSACNLCWDSSVINEHPQRYTNINHFLTLVEKEIILEAEKSRQEFDVALKAPTDRTAPESPAEKATKTKTHDSNQDPDSKPRTEKPNSKRRRSRRQSGVQPVEKDLTEEQRKEEVLKMSRDGYLQRKQQGQQHIIDEAKKKEGLLVEYLIEVYSKRVWKKAIIKRCKVVWIDDGTKVRISYILQDWKIDAPPESKSTENQTVSTKNAAVANIVADLDAPEYELDLALYRHFTVTIEEATDIHVNRLKSKYVNYNPILDQELKVLNEQEQSSLEDNESYFDNLLRITERKFNKKKKLLKKRINAVQKGLPFGSNSPLLRGISKVGTLLTKGLSSAALVSRNALSRALSKKNISPINPSESNVDINEDQASDQDSVGSDSSKRSKNSLKSRSLRGRPQSEVISSEMSDGNDETRSVDSGMSNNTSNLEFEQMLDDEEQEEDAIAEESRAEQLAVFIAAVKEEIKQGKLEVTLASPTKQPSSPENDQSTSQVTLLSLFASKKTGPMIGLSSDEKKKLKNDFIISTAEMRMEAHIRNANREKKLNFLNDHLNNIIQTFESTQGEYLKQKEITKNNIKRDHNIRRYHIIQDIKQKQERQRLQLIRSVTIESDIFKKAVKQPVLCEHINKKSWSSLYDSGVRCQDCGKEMSGPTWLEECQYKGFGYDQPLEFHHNRERFTKNEYSYRFKTSSELQEIEADVEFVEKERREVTEENIHFYDFNETVFINKFDSRHRINNHDRDHTKKAVQLEFGVIDDVVKKKGINTSAIEEDIILLKPTISTIDVNFADEEQIAINECDWQDTICTYREPEAKRHVQFQELMFNMGRMHNFVKKIELLVGERNQLLTANKLLVTNICVLHDINYYQTRHLNEIELDLDKTSRLIETYKRMMKLWYQAQLILVRAVEERERAESHFKIINEARDIGFHSLNACHDKLHSLLRQRNDILPQIEIFKRALKYQEELSEAAKANYNEKMKDTYDMRYVEPGAAVMTKYGYGIVRLFREADRMAFITLYFGRPHAKVYMRLDEVTKHERKLQAAERERMSEEETLTRFLLFKESVSAKRELARMRKEDATMKEYIRIIEKMRRDKEEMQAAVTKAILDSQESFEKLTLIETAKIIQDYFKEKKGDDSTVGATAGSLEDKDKAERKRQMKMHFDMNRIKAVIENQKKIKASQSSRKLAQASVESGPEAAVAAGDNPLSVTFEDSNNGLDPYDVRSVNPALDMDSLEESNRSLTTSGSLVSNLSSVTRFVTQASTVSQSFLKKASSVISLDDSVGTSEINIKGMSSWQLFKRRKDILSEIRHKFIHKSVDDAEKRVQAVQNDRPMVEIIDFFSNYLITETAVDMLREALQEVIQEGLDNKLALQKATDIYFPKPKWLQEGPYKSMLMTWNLHKEHLEMRLNDYEIANSDVFNEIENEGDNQSLSVSAAGSVAKSELERKQTAEKAFLNKKKMRRMTMNAHEIERQRLKDLKVKEELERMAKMNEEMFNEEMLTRRFYEWEFTQTIHERRAMREEDDLAHDVREEYKRQQELLLRATTEGADANELYGKRRLEIQKVVRERRNLELERALMVLEDKVGAFMREEDIHERQKASLLYQTVHSDDEDSYGSNKLIEIPDWLYRPPDWDDWNVTQQIKYIKFRTKMKKRYAVVDKKVADDATTMLEVQTNSYEGWSRIYEDFEFISNQAEYEYIILLEDQNKAEFNLLELQYRLNQFITDCRLTGNEQLRLQHEYDVLCITYTKILAVLMDCLAWEKKCKGKQKSRNRAKLKIEQECLYIDSMSSTGFHQRFYTDIFRKAIYIQFFQEVVYWIANLAETIATEKALLVNNEQLTINSIHYEARLAGLSDFRKMLRRKDCLRMKRSVLNQSFFPRHRRNLLQESFSSWVRYLRWNQNQRDEYLLNFQVIRNNMALNEVFKDFKEDADTVQNSLIDIKSDSAGNRPKEKKNLSKAKKAIRDYNNKNAKLASTDPMLLESQRKPITTLMDDYQTRSITCQFCSRLYSESQNHSKACYFHSKPYRFYCPTTCPKPGKTPNCVNHRTKRWTCCDRTDKNDTGCCNGFHKPPLSDPTYDQNAAILVEQNKLEMEQLTKQVEHARNWEERLHVTRQTQIDDIQKLVVDDRRRASTFEIEFKKIAVLPEIFSDPLYDGSRSVHSDYDMSRSLHKKDQQE